MFLSLAWLNGRTISGLVQDSEMQIHGVFDDYSRTKMNTFKEL